MSETWIYEFLADAYDSVRLWRGIVFTGIGIVCGLKVLKLGLGYVFRWVKAIYNIIWSTLGMA